MEHQGVGRHLGSPQECVPCALAMGCWWRGARTLLLSHLSSPALPFSVLLLT